MYKVITRISFETFIHDVNTEMSNGWKCQGGIFVTSGGFYQAMVKETTPAKGSSLIGGQHSISEFGDIS